MLFYSILLLALLAGALYVYLCKVPHGWVEWRTGLILKFLPSLDDREPVALRRSLEHFANKRKHLIKVPVQDVRDMAIRISTGEINARIYDDSNGEAKDLILFIHGGGWCIGSINVYEEQGRRIAKATGLPTMLFDYSLAPEHPFPKAHDECLEIARSIIRQEGDLNYERIILLGDSAGGNMALSVARSLAQSTEIERVRCIVAVYPVTDGSGHTTESRERYSTGYYLTKKAMSNFTHALTPGVLSSSDPRLDLLHADGWERLPPTFILTAGFDPLRDEGEAMVKKLRDAGVTVAHKRYEGAIHAFFALKDFGQKGLIAVEDVATFIKTY